MWQWLSLIKGRVPALQTDYDLDCTSQDSTTSSRGKRVYFFSKASGLVLGLTHRPIQWVPEAASLGVKRPGRKANYSSSSNAEVKYRQAILPLTNVPSFLELGQLYVLIIPTGWWEEESISNSPSSCGNFFAT
jgi:hypothetical protein